jgi:glycosyltransferase involved in cell wall biosynthesis
MSTAPLISVVIPTRERARTLHHTLRTVLAQPGDRFEVIVSDNVSEDGTRDVVEGLADPRLRYVRTDRRLSMCDNWDFAFRHVRGRYAIVIGDDDALAVGAIPDLERFVLERPFPVYYWEPSIYKWPSKESGPRLSRWARSSRTEAVALRPRVAFSFRWGGLAYMRLPLLYHALVSMDVLDRIRQRTGRLFHSTQPDVFMAFALPVFCDEALWIGRSVTHYGEAEDRSATHTIGKEESELAVKIDRFLREYGDYPLHATLCPAVPFWVNMIPDAMLVARDLFPEYYRDIPFDYDAMWAFLWRYWRFDTISGIAARRREFRRYHPFHLVRYWGIMSIHLASEGRMALRRLAGRSRTDVPMPDCPTNIYDFARRMAAAEERA